MRRASRCHLSMSAARVAVAEEQQVHLVRGRTVLDHGPHTARGRRRRAIDERRGGVDRHRPQLLEGRRAAAAGNDHAHRGRGRGETDRLVERARDFLRFRRASPTRRRCWRRRARKGRARSRPAPRTGTCRARSRRARGRGGPATALREPRRRARTAPRPPCRCERSRRAGCGSVPRRTEPARARRRRGQKRSQPTAMVAAEGRRTWPSDYHRGSRPGRGGSLRFGGHSACSSAALSCSSCSPFPRPRPCSGRAPSPSAPGKAWSPRRTSWPRRWGSRSCGRAATPSMPRWPRRLRSRSRIRPRATSAGAASSSSGPPPAIPRPTTSARPPPRAARPRCSSPRACTTRRSTTRATCPWACRGRWPACTWPGGPTASSPGGGCSSPRSRWPATASW